MMILNQTIKGLFMNKRVVVLILAIIIMLCVIVAIRLNEDARRNTFNINRQVIELVL
jgi:hypothetical protein